MVHGGVSNRKNEEITPNPVKKTRATTTPMLTAARHPVLIAMTVLVSTFAFFRGKHLIAAFIDWASHYVNGDVLAALRRY